MENKDKIEIISEKLIHEEIWELEDGHIALNRLEHPQKTYIIDEVEKELDTK